MHEEKRHENNAENRSSLQNDISRSPWYVKIFMDSGSSASIIHDSFVHTNILDTKKSSVDK